jgi:hypothetical protein
MLGYLASQNAIARRNPGQAAGKATLALDDFSLLSASHTLPWRSHETERLNVCAGNFVHGCF